MKRKTATATQKQKQKPKPARKPATEPPLKAAPMAADFETFEPARGFRVFVHPTSKFKTIHLAVYVHQPLGDEATRLALLPFVLRRGCRGFPDMRVSIHDPVAEGDMVAWRGVIEATHLGDFMGIPATGRRVTIEEYHIERMRDGLMAEHWGLFDKLALLQQLGAVPPAPAA